jgi:hypothetical protein
VNRALRQYLENPGRTWDQLEAQPAEAAQSMLGMSKRGQLVMRCAALFLMMPAR